MTLLFVANFTAADRCPKARMKLEDAGSLFQFVPKSISDTACRPQVRLSSVFSEGNRIALPDRDDGRRPNLPSDSSGLHKAPKGL